MIQDLLFPDFVDESIEDKTSGTFVDNMKLPIHRWYRYTAGFSAAWVGDLIEREKLSGRCHVLDPFAGSGTVPVEGLLHDVEARGIEANPYVYNIATAKVRWIGLDPDDLERECLSVLTRAGRLTPAETKHPDLVEKCFPPETLKKLDALKRAREDICDQSIKEFVWFIVTSILRPCSPVGTAQWQYIQPRKSKAKVADPFDAYQNKVFQVLSDIRSTKGKIGNQASAAVFREDARDIRSIPDGWADLVITSPPYANNYDYADAMRLEMYFWNDIEDWADLQTKVSSKLVRACTQHVASLKDSVPGLLDDPILAPIREPLRDRFSQLSQVRELHGGKKNYNLMIVAYFHDMARVFHSLFRTTAPNAKMCFVVGDSAPYGIHVPVEEWLGELAASAGFSKWSFEKLRDRNTKWKNRKHRVPLKEGRLWIQK